jgi:fumarate reductase subunit D
MRRSNEPLVWLPFAGGMMADAMLVPALALITGVLAPLGMVSEAGFRALLLNPLVRFVLFGLIALTFFHAAHRIRFTLADLGLKALKPALPLLCYGAAVVGTILAGLIALGNR